MKLALGLIGASLAIVGGTVVGVHAAQPQASHRSQDSMTVSGYEGWWNATPVKGSAAGLPQETVAVSTRTGTIVDAFNRAKNDAGESTSVSDVHFDVVPDPSWPKDSVVIIDTASGRVIESFPVDEKGRPVISEEKSAQLAANYPPQPGSTKASDDEVRKHVSVDSMVASGMSAAQIQRYYPDYSPTAK